MPFYQCENQKLAFTLLDIERAETCFARLMLRQEERHPAFNTAVVLVMYFLCHSALVKASKFTGKNFFNITNRNHCHKYSSSLSE